MAVVFTGEVWPWRGLSTFHFVTVPQPESDELRRLAGRVTYGWGTLPLKAPVRRSEGIELGDTITVRLAVSERD